MGNGRSGYFSHPAWPGLEAGNTSKPTEGPTGKHKFN